MWNLLLDGSGTSLPEGYQKIGVGEALVDALLGFIVVFIGIAFLIGVIWLVGFCMRKATGTGDGAKGAASPVTEKEKAVTRPDQAVVLPAAGAEEELSEEMVAVITAALMAYYAKETPKCEFTVKRIRKI